jgi:hypothetical protein
VLIEMALNIRTIVTTLQSGQQISTAEAAAIQNISAQASKDLNPLATLYNEYKTNSSASTPAEDPGRYRRHRPEPAGPLAGGAHRRSGSLGPGHSWSQSDPDDGRQLRGADATDFSASRVTQAGPPRTCHL